MPRHGFLGLKAAVLSVEAFPIKANDYPSCELNAAARNDLGFGDGSRFLDTVTPRPMTYLGQRCFFNESGSQEPATDPWNFSTG